MPGYRIQAMVGYVPASIQVSEFRELRPALKLDQLTYPVARAG